MSLLAMIIAAVIFFLDGVNVKFPHNQIAWGLFFVALSFVLGMVWDPFPVQRRGPAPSA